MNQREAFEKWCENVGYTGMQVIKLPGDVYASSTVNALWEAWQAATASQWQPIDTAPKDGRALVAKIELTSMEVIHTIQYSNSIGCWVSSWDGTVFCKDYAQAFAHDNSVVATVTHWHHSL